ncbi:hypothetical protein LXA43DRAFT_884033 [Ganoderma leucocontextum]|nr:hypothetical protein LXA43DRAFT_884033 [Ganoderma leucocontextum]
MSAPAYRLETPRPRPPPLPIRTNKLPIRDSQILGQKDAPNTLLYDLPSSTPTSPTRITSPTSPTSPYSPRSPSTRRASKMMSPKTPSRPMQSELEEFTEHCRSWYFQQDDDAGRRMTQTLATLPPSQRAPFARLQASIRSAYHASVTARRDVEFKAHLNATKPGGSLMPHSRADPNGQLAKKERYERLDRFIRTWCTMGMPGTKPFFEGLWAVMRLQVVPQALGGAGPYRIEWEIDDAVFKESGGKDFMLEAIDVLKGVLAFDETTTLSRTPSTNSSAQYPAFTPLSPIHSRSQSQPLPSGERPPSTRPHKHPPIASTTQTKRPRAPSDPFLDTPTLSTSYSSAKTAASGLSTSGSSAADEPITPTTPLAEVDDLFPPASANRDFAEADGGYLRTWTAPDLPNPEFISLLSLFPPFIAQTAAPRFPVAAASRRLADEEEGQAEDGRKEIRVGTGSMWLGPKRRVDGYKGGWWTRFKLWLARVFC